MKQRENGLSTLKIPKDLLKKLKILAIERDEQLGDLASRCIQRSFKHFESKLKSGETIENEE